MKLSISYFAQIRNFPQNYVPVSTAMYQPKWFGTSPHLDSEGRILGVCYPRINPENCHAVQCCPCNDKKNHCQFLVSYYRGLPSFDEAMLSLGIIEEWVIQHTHIPDPVLVLMVYERPDNPCSERRPLQGWFKVNGYSLPEFPSTIEIPCSY